MKKSYIAPQISIINVENEYILAGSGTKAGASIGGEGSPNEQNQDEIHEGGPGIAGAKWTEFD
ncbi:hypothetical protein [Prevotella falsenii]|uniref:hypothetical protein n=1 Tax=Prevotella falsenii TaxID=515414 RepID=UPI000468F46E|nr:hypothetical protein [Prevotella falsenii]